MLLFVFILDEDHEAIGILVSIDNQKGKFYTYKKILAIVSIRNNCL